MCIYILCIPTLNFAIIMHMARIASSIDTVFQINSVHNLLGRNTADIDFEDNSSLLSESESQEENTLTGTGVLSTNINYHWQTL
jgi:hypothetical protein